MPRPSRFTPQDARKHAHGARFASHFHVLPPEEAAQKYSRHATPLGGSTPWVKGFRKHLAEILAEHKAKGRKMRLSFKLVRNFHAEFEGVLPIVERRGLPDPAFVPSGGSISRYPAERLKAYRRPVLLSSRKVGEHRIVQNLLNQLDYFSVAIPEGRTRMLSHAPAAGGAYVFVQHTTRGTEKIVRMGGEFDVASPTQRASGAHFRATSGGEYHFLRTHSGKLYFWYSEGGEELWGDEMFRELSPSQAGTGPSGPGRRR